MLQCLSGTLRAHTDITAGWFSFSPLLATCIQALTDAVQQRKSEARWLSLLFAHIPSLLLQSEEQSLTHLFQHHLTSLRHSDFTTISEEHMFCINTGYHGRGGKNEDLGVLMCNSRFFCLWMTYLQTRGAAGEEGGVRQLFCCGMNTPLN